MLLPPADSLRAELANLYKQRNLVEDMIRTLQRYAMLRDEPLDEAGTAVPDPDIELMPANHLVN